ncbi:MAG: hypothetical protein ACHQDC_03290 [Acidimicrobiales bacterium]|jgi:hypothetical protein
MEKTFRNLVVLAGVGLLILVIWRNPTSAATDVGDVFGNIWDFIREALQKLADFFGSLGGS